ncbi:MAG: flagellar basal body-associated protein FliL [Epsilonproteobacteria bacterium]|nr:flagellar basal body-associated protein FliL [Campylobacterota bacterium]
MAEEAQANAAVAEKKGGSNIALIIIIVLLFLLLIGGGVAAYLLLNDSGDEEMMKNQASQTQVEKKEDDALLKKKKRKLKDLLEVGPMYPMDQFIVNLLSENGSRYLKATIDLEMDKQELSAELDKKKAIIRDIIIRILSSKTFEEISTIKGKERLKEEIVDKINEILVDGEIKNIFFTDFVIQ